jgi:hypothetical protein
MFPLTSSSQLWILIQEHFLIYFELADKFVLQSDCKKREVRLNTVVGNGKSPHCHLHLRQSP